MRVLSGCRKVSNGASGSECNTKALIRRIGFGAHLFGCLLLQLLKCRIEFGRMYSYEGSVRVWCYPCSKISIWGKTLFFQPSEFVCEIYLEAAAMRVRKKATDS